MMNQPMLAQRIVDFLIDNIFTLITIIVAGYVVYRQEFSGTAVPINDLLAAILAVLGLLATSEIVERHRRLSSIENAVNRSLSFLESRFTDRPSAIAFFQKMPSLDSYIQGASQIDLCGVTLSSTLNKQFGNLRERLQSGAQIRILIIDPDPGSTAIKMSAERSATPEDTDYYRARLEPSIRELEYLFKSWADFENFQGNAFKTGNLAVRLLSYAPSFGISSFNANQEHGLMVVELYPHKSGFESPPCFELTPQRDGNWYKYFTEQFDQMWNAAKPWQPRNVSQPGVV